MLKGKFAVVAIVMMGILAFTSVDINAQLKDRIRDRVNETRDRVSERTAEARRAADERTRQAAERARQERDRLQRAAEEHARQAAERARQERDRLQRAADERARQAAEQVRQHAPQVQRRIQEGAADVSQRARTTGQQLRDSSAAQSLRDVAYHAAAHSASVLADPGNQEAFVQRAASIGRNVSLATLRKVPVYDSSQNRFVTLDTLMRDMVSEMGGYGMEGSDLHNDPLAVSFALMFDANAFDTVRIIQHPSTGEWVSMNEAMHSLSSGTATTSMRKTVYSYESTRLSHRLNYHEGFGRTSAKFIEQLSPEASSAKTHSKNSKMGNMAIAASANMRDSQLILASFVSSLHERLASIYEAMGISKKNAPDMASVTILIMFGGLVFFALLFFVRRRNLKKEIDELKKQVMAGNPMKNKDKQNATSV
jgi:hypothetical protein